MSTRRVTEHFTPKELEDAVDLEDKIYCDWLAPKIAESLRILVKNSLKEGNPLPERFSFFCSDGEGYQAHIYGREGQRTMLIRVSVPLTNHNMEMEVAISY